MSNFRTAEEAKQNYIESMGKPLGLEFYALWQEVTWLYINWSQYIELYGTKPSRVEMLNDTAPSFFRIVQDALWEQTLLHIARLTDRASTAGKSNLTIQRLPDLIDERDVANEVRRLVGEALRSCEFCRDWRNRRIAHSDLELAIGVGSKPLKSASRNRVNRALDSLTRVLNSVTRHYMESQSFFNVGGEYGGAMSLLFVIDDGLREQERHRARLRRGEYSNEDFELRDL